MDKVNLKGGWDTLWGAIGDAVGSQVLTLMTIVGVVLVVFAIGKWIWDKRRGGGGGLGAVFWTLLIGGILAAPGAIIPLLLGILDAIINALIALIQATG